MSRRHVIFGTQTCDRIHGGVCQNCCHSFDSEPVTVPYNDNGDRFGRYCSYGCAKRGIYPYNGPALSGEMLEFEFNNKHGWGKGIKIAPPRLTLNLFGGPLTVEKYRECPEYFVGYDSNGAYCESYTPSG